MKKTLSLLLSLVLTLSLITMPNVSAASLDATSKDGIAPLIEYRTLTAEEFDSLLNSKSDTSYKLTDNYWSKFSAPYYTYVDNMTAKQKEFYDSLYAALYAMIDGGDDCTAISDRYFAPAIACTGLTDVQAQNVAELMMYVHPELYFLDGSMIMTRSGLQKAVQLGVYEDFATGEKRSSVSATLKTKIDSYLAQVTGTTAYEKEKSIHDLICDNVEYDLDSTYNQSCASVFLNGRTICAGYAESFALLCYANNIPAISLTSEEHEWNEVKLGDNWYIVDTTWDDSYGGYEFFNKSERSIYNFSEESKEMHTPETTLWLAVEYPISLMDYDPDSDTVADVYRLYNPNSGEHFYTMNYNEKVHLVATGWSDEGIGWKAPLEGYSTTPVYRVYSPATGDHHYTTDEAEKIYLVAVGWSDEGISWYSDDDKAVRLYRLYNPNATGAGSHHYTLSVGEKDYLENAGWSYEGTAWYGKQ